MGRRWEDIPLWRKVGIQFREVRELHNLTQTEAAKKLGFELKRYKRIERGFTEDLTLKEVVNTVKKFKCTVQEILPVDDIR